MLINYSSGFLKPFNKLADRVLSQGAQAQITAVFHSEWLCQINSISYLKKNKKIKLFSPPDCCLCLCHYWNRVSALFELF